MSNLIGICTNTINIDKSGKDKFVTYRNPLCYGEQGFLIKEKIFQPYQGSLSINLTENTIIIIRTRGPSASTWQKK